MTHTQEIQTFQTLPEQINWEHDQAQHAARSALDHALKAGELLIQAKQQCAYGEWLLWVNQNCQFAERTARLYMQLARRRECYSEPEWQRVADLPLREAVKCLGQEPSQTLAKEDAGEDERIKRAQQQIHVLQLALKEAVTVEDYVAIINETEEVEDCMYKIKINNLIKLGNILNKIKEMPPWQRTICEMILEGGESARAARQALDEWMQELKQEQGCEQREVSA